MKQTKRFTTKKIVMVGVLAALTCVGSAIRIQVPDAFGTSAFHLGNILCALCGVLLGPWFGGLAAGLGSAIYDTFNPAYVQDCWITFLTKGAYGILAGLVIRSGKGNWNYGKALLATITGAVGYGLIYLGKCLFYDRMLINGLPLNAALLSVSTKIPPTIFNAVVAIIATPVLAIALRKALSRSRLSID